jgi:hypothetical protein
MPILPAEPETFPEDLWDSDLIRSENVRWWCLHTKPRQEKATARHLLDRRIGYYLPQVPRVGRTPGRRKIRSMMPLFPCYVFLLGDEYQRLEAFRGGTLVNVLEVADQPCLVRDLRQIHQMLASGLPVALEPTHPVGARVRIASGPLTGVVGAVIRRGPRDRFVAIVNFLSSGAVVDLEDWQVERVDPPPS